MGNIPEERAPSCLTEFEQQCADLDAKDWNPRQIAAVLEVGESAVRQALVKAARKMDPPARQPERVERMERRHLRRDIEAAALNYYTEELTVAEVPKGEEPPLRWAPWPFRDHAPQQA